MPYIRTKVAQMQSDDTVPIPDKRQTAVMMGHFKVATKEPNEFIRFVMSEDNACVWYIKFRHIFGFENEFEGGEYIIKMIAPENFPYAPPRFYFLTENGIYQVGVKVCVAIGEYHKEDYPAALGMAGFAGRLLGGMTGWKDLGAGINIIKTSVAEKQRLAKASVAANEKNYADINKMIEDSYKGYSAKWDKTKIKPDELEKLGLAVDTVQNSNN